ncbi:TlpA family protein disulfide reductase [Pontibacter russatus]|uniref:TlpA family protein disulfide reductase n=1 Tax=Pontibacter russatus TaxID=2694929 RepID=UPI00137A0552|nr:redoxin domain-containing protein [Pontibacter russatus]
MKKGIILLTVTIAVLLAVFLADLVINSNEEVAEPATGSTTTAPAVQSAAAPVAAAPNELPKLPLTTLDGNKLMVNELEGSTVLVLFQPDCDHCQREAAQIRENIAAFDDYQIYFISDASLPQLDQFAQTYKLADQRDVYFAQTTINDILNEVGPIETPSLFVYSPEGRLVKSFIGETPIEEILKVL